MKKIEWRPGWKYYAKDLEVIAYPLEGVDQFRLRAIVRWLDDSNTSFVAQLERMHADKIWQEQELTDEDRLFVVQTLMQKAAQ